MKVAYGTTWLRMQFDERLLQVRFLGAFLDKGFKGCQPVRNPSGYSIIKEQWPPIQHY